MANLDDMRVFAQLAASGSFSAAARELGVTKQTVSRRLMGLEETLGVELVRRTTRRMTLTEVGKAYALRCAEVTRLAEEANRAAASQTGEVAGTLRITADHIVGEAFLPGLVAHFTGAHQQVEVEVMLTSRKVDLLEEGFDVAFRIGLPPDVHHLSAMRLGPARLWTVASPAYLDARGTPTQVDDLKDHDCVAALPHLTQRGWPFVIEGSLRLVEVPTRLRVNGLVMTRHAALAGVGIAHLPSFAVAADIEAGALVRILTANAPDVGGVHVIYPHSQLLAPKVSEFVALAVEMASSFA